MKKKIPKKLMPIIEETKKKLKEIYGDRLIEIILYGSYARGDSIEGSDIDLILLLKDMKDLFVEQERYFDEIHQIDLKYDTLISIIPFDVVQYNTRKLPLILNSKKEGIIL